MGGDVEALKVLQSLLADFDLPSDFSGDFLNALYEFDEVVEKEIERIKFMEKQCFNGGDSAGCSCPDCGPCLVDFGG